MIPHSEQLRHGLNWNALLDQVADVSLSKPAQAHCGRQPNHASTRSENACQRFQHVWGADQLGIIGMTRGLTMSGHTLHHGWRERHGSPSRSADTDLPTLADRHDVSPAYRREFRLVDARPVDQRENGVVSDGYGVGRDERRESQTLLGRRVESVIHAFENTGAELGALHAMKANRSAIRKLKEVSLRDSIATGKPKLLTTPCQARANELLVDQKSAV